MSKMLLCVSSLFLIFCLITNDPVSANQPSNSFELGLYPVGAAASYERLIVNHLALFIRGNYLMTLETGGPPESIGLIAYESGELGATYYVNKAFKGFYMQMGLGWATGGFPGSNGANYDSVSITVMLGWKIDIYSWLFSRFGFGINIQPNAAAVPLINAGLGINF